MASKLLNVFFGKPVYLENCRKTATFVSEEDGYKIIFDKGVVEIKQEGFKDVWVGMSNVQQMTPKDER